MMSNRRSKLYAILIAVCLVLITPTQQRHDGGTVDRMLARYLGQGTGEGGSIKKCSSVGDCEDMNNVTSDSSTDDELCWGYEKKCNKMNRLFVPQCDGPAKPWATDMDSKQEEFWRQGDFGYVKNEVDSLKTICKPSTKWDSKLRCSDNMRYCEARNLYIDFKRFKEITGTEGKYKSFLEDIFHDGEVGGHCEMNYDLLRKHGEHKSPLQSWYAELETYTSLSFRPRGSEHCDETITKPTIFIKLDAGINLYHHYCDFFNLYASQHINGSFNDDIFIVMWDTSYRPYMDLFSDTWRAFSKHPLKRLSDFEGKRMCFQDAVFPLLARMRRGLYYNTYLLPGCHGSGLMQAFSKHVVSRLGVEQMKSEADRVRVTLLSRSTKHRRIVNENELVSAMKTVPFFDVKVVDYKARVFPFIQQVNTSHNSDVFIGMHGSGLTHMLFQPDWGGVFEIYNTEDPRCYENLARLRGLEYVTWENGEKVWPEGEGKHPTLGTPHAKFTNYTFDVEEFMRLVTDLGDHVRRRKMDTLSVHDTETHQSLSHNEL